MPRLFVAIDFPPPLKRSLAELCSGVRGARWVAPANFHLTLRFIGGVDAAAAAQIEEALRRVRARRFPLQLGGAGQFAGHTLWVGVAENPALHGLQSAVERELQGLGLPPEPRPYQPHVKLARSPRRSSFRAFIDEHASFRAEPFEVADFSLIESRLFSTGPVYSHMADYALAADEAAAAEASDAPR